MLPTHRKFEIAITKNT